MGYSTFLCYTTVDIDECESNPCQNGGACVDAVGGYRCTCMAGFGGNTAKQVRKVLMIILLGINTANMSAHCCDVNLKIFLYSIVSSPLESSSRFSL